ncbi:MAG: TRAP transporter substrate-binding protein [Phreatobacter sp.]
MLISRRALIRALPALGAAGALASGISGAHGQDLWRIASAAPSTGILREHHERIALRIGTASTGAVQSAFQYVSSEQEALQQIARGRLQGGIISMIALGAIVPEAGVLLTPFLFETEAEAEWVIRNRLADRLRPLLEAKGLALVGFAAGGWVNVASRSALTSPADVRGRKIRASPAPASQFFWSSLGANPVQLPIGELFSALEQGLVEGADLPFTFYVASPAAVSTPHYTLTRHGYNFSGVIVNLAAWNKLSAAQKAGILAGLPTLETLNREFERSEAELAEKFRGTGGSIHALSAEERRSWIDAIAARQHAFVGGLGAPSSAFFEAVQAGRRDFAATRS